MTHILSVEQLRKLGRPIGKMVDSTKLEAFITEAEQLHVKPIIGDSLYLRLLSEIEKEEIKDRDILLLLEGGKYNSKDYGKSKDDDVHLFMGLREALSYYVYAKNVMSGDIESTRFGMNIKENEYSNHVSDKSRSTLYNGIIEIAKSYLDECVAFCKICGLIKEQGKSKVNIGGCTIRKIG